MPESRPNIVFITTDQQRFDTISALGAEYMETPALDRLVEEGVAFTDCHVTAPSCAPSRASLFTGYYPHTTGVLRNGDRWTSSWIEDLSASGYYTVNVGKMHTAPYDAPMGFDERYEVENKDRYLAPVPAGEPPLPGEKYYLDEWDRALQARGLLKQQREFYRRREDYEERLGAFEWELPEDAHPDVFVGDFAERWLNRMPKLDAPLFMEIGFPGPHPPYDPTPEYAEQYLRKDLPMPKLSEADLAGQPEPMRGLREHHQTIDHDSVVHDPDASDERLHRQRAYYYANVGMIDEQVGKIMDALEANGYDDTIVFFTSDHGEMLTDHGHIQKWTMYEEVTRVPTMVWSPGRFEPATVEELVSLFDLGPTVLELGDAPVDDTMEAESLVPALRGEEDWSGRDVVFAEHARTGILDTTDFMTMVRTDDWKIVHFVDKNEGQLFDLSEDPEEERNLWDDPDAQDVKRDLLDTLRDWRINSDLRTQDWAAEFR
jgi:arylsulfatase A-like enzyme